MRKLTLAALLALLVSGCAADPVRIAPEFDLQRIAGGDMKSADLKGKVVVIDFWATWCDPCKEEIPSYNKLADSLPAGATLVSIAMNSGSFEEVKKKVGEFGIQYPVLLGTDEVEEGFGGLRGYPTTFVVSKDWKIYKKYEGLVAKKSALIQQDITTLLD
jgi:thiol-disulfide isomerase/thioredoxin